MALLGTFSHNGITLDVCLTSYEPLDEVPEVVHQTATRTRLRYLVGVRQRTATIAFRVRTAAEHDAVISFYRTVIQSGSRFDFVPDTEIPDDVWSAVFASGLTFRRLTEVSDPLVGEFTVDIEDQAVEL